MTLFSPFPAHFSLVRHSYLVLLLSLLTFDQALSQPLMASQSSNSSDDSVEQAILSENGVQGDKKASDVPSTMLPLRNAWRQGRSLGKPVMLVLGADDCDRCALLTRYLTDDEGLRQRVNRQFVIHSLDVGSPESMIEIEEGADLLPIVLLLDSAKPFESLMQSNDLLTFLPEPNEPIFDWFENVLAYTEQNLALL